MRAMGKRARSGSITGISVEGDAGEAHRGWRCGKSSRERYRAIGAADEARAHESSTIAAALHPQPREQQLWSAASADIFIALFCSSSKRLAG
jgi:hypothetical protein